MKKKYRFEIIGYGFERVYAKIDKKKYNYWNKNNLNDLLEEDNKRGFKYEAQRLTWRIPD